MEGKGEGGAREESWEGRNWERGERESLVISISIPSTACTVRQPVCPNKQPAEGGCLIITSPLFSHPEFTFHLTINTRPGLWPCPLSPLEFRDVSRASKATIHMLFSTWRGQYSTRHRPGRGKTKTQCEFIMFSPLRVLDRRPLQPDALSGGRGVIPPLRRPLFTRLRPSLSNSLSLKDPSAPRRRQLHCWDTNLNYWT